MCEALQKVDEAGAEESRRSSRDCEGPSRACRSVPAGMVVAAVLRAPAVYRAQRCVLSVSQLVLCAPRPTG